MSSDLRSVVRSLLVPPAPFRGEFKIDVKEWLAMTPTSQGPVLLCSVWEAEAPKPASSLLNAQGQRILPTAPEAPTWEVVCVQDGQEDPGPDWYFLGGIAANNPAGELTGLFYFARRKP